MTDMREKLALQIRSALSEFNDQTLPVVECVKSLAQAARTGGEVEPSLKAWVLFDSSEVKKYIKKYDDGSLAIFDTEAEAKKAKRKYPHTDYKRVDYYTHPAPVAKVPDVAGLVEALESLLDMQDEDCRYDHQGYCQNHNLDHVEDGCRVARARTALTAAPPPVEGE